VSITTYAGKCAAALIGFPGAGKSTLFNALTGRTDSRKMPRYALVRGTSLVLVDIGGISRRTISGVNPGAAFLRHVETAKTLVYVIALAEGWVKEYGYLRKTVCAYKESFQDKKRIIVLNRFDGRLDGVDEETAARVSETLPGEIIIPLNAAGGGGLPALVHLLLEMEESPCTMCISKA
jgi:GTPase involved in cell partitioning and DNA repair